MVVGLVPTSKGIASLYYFVIFILVILGISYFAFKDFFDRGLMAATRVKGVAAEAQLLSGQASLDSAAMNISWVDTKGAKVYGKIEISKAYSNKVFQGLPFNRITVKTAAIKYLPRGEIGWYYRPLISANYVVVILADDLSVGRGCVESNYAACYDIGR
jgi:hypothetical protein